MSSDEDNQFTALDSEMDLNTQNFNRVKSSFRPDRHIQCELSEIREMYNEDEPVESRPALRLFSNSRKSEEDHWR